MNIKTKSNFDVRILSIKEIHTLPNSWSYEDYRNILKLADFEYWYGLHASELKEYTLLALQGFEPDEAAELVLKYKFEEQLKPGQIQNLAHEMMGDKLWEEYQDIRLHKELYNCAGLMKEVFPRDFPETDAIVCRLEVSAQNQPGRELLLQADKPFVARLLAHGMEDAALINRLFDDRITGNAFGEADSIIWDFTSERADHQVLFTIFSSNYWFHNLAAAPSKYLSSAFPDTLSVK